MYCKTFLRQKQFRQWFGSEANIGTCDFFTFKSKHLSPNFATWCGLERTLNFKALEVGRRFLHVRNAFCCHWENLPASLFAHALQRKNGFISLSLWFHLCCTCFSVSVGQIFWRAYIWATAASVKEQCSVLLVILLWCRSKEEGVEKPKLWLIFFLTCTQAWYNSPAFLDSLP